MVLPTPLQAFSGMPKASATTEKQTIVDGEKMTGAEALVRSLEDLGVKDVFGVPGGAILPVYDSIKDDTKFRFVLMRHEQAAGHAAEGYALTTGQVGVCIVTSGPGATNMITPIADANMDSIPMVVITGQVGVNAIGTDAFQEADIVGATYPVVKHSYLVTRAQDIPRVLAEAHYIARSGRPGPVVVDVTKTAQTGEMYYSWPQRMILPGYNPTTKAHGRVLSDAAKLFSQSYRPVLYVGGGAARSNAVGVVWDGKVYLVCGGSTIQLDNVPGAAEHNGQAVRISSSQKEKVSLSDQRNSLSGDLLVSTRKMGSRPLAENVLIFDGGKAIGINQLTVDQVPDSQILYARANWAGEVDLIVLDRAVDQLVGRVFVESTQSPVYDDEGNVVGSEWKDRVGLEYGNGSDQRVGPFGVRYGVQAGDFVTAKLNSKGTGFVSMSKLTELRNVPSSSWIGTSAVTFGGRTYTLDPNTVLCYNSDGRMWITLDEARAYADTFNLHVKDGVVYVVEVGG